MSTSPLFWCHGKPANKLNTAWCRHGEGPDGLTIRLSCGAPSGDKSVARIRSGGIWLQSYLKELGRTPDNDGYRS